MASAASCPASSAGGGGFSSTSGGCPLRIRGWLPWRTGLMRRSGGDGDEHPCSSSSSRLAAAVSARRRGERLALFRRCRSRFVGRFAAAVQNGRMLCDGRAQRSASALSRTGSDAERPGHRPVGAVSQSIIGVVRPANWPIDPAAALFVGPSAALPGETYFTWRATGETHGRAARHPVKSAYNRGFTGRRGQGAGPPKPSVRPDCSGQEAGAKGRPQRPDAGAVCLRQPMG